jgi:acyl-coenzyme A synthetase/AMP-(fatty) acid ligase
VKIGGNRVELSEIDHVVRGDPEVLNAVTVVAPDEARSALACFVVTRGAAPWAELTTRLRTRLSAALPRYMVPRHFHRLDALPLLSNGKIDRVRLGQLAAGARPAPQAGAPS